MMDNILDVCSELNIGHIRADFLGKGNIWINNTYSSLVVKLAQHIICEAIFKTAPGQLTVYGFDRELSGLFAPFASLSAGESRILHFITDEKNLLDQLKTLQQQIQEVQNVVQGREESLIEFRSKIPALSIKGSFGCLFQFPPVAACLLRFPLPVRHGHVKAHDQINGFDRIFISSKKTVDKIW